MDVEVKALYLFGLLETVADIQTLVIVMVTRTVYSHFRYLVPHKEVISPGI